MVYLLIVSLIWAFSFGLIKGNLTNVDSNFVAFARLFISFLIFLPFIKLNSVNNGVKIKLLLVGAIQYGLMYISYLYAFQFLKAYEIVLFTIFTPIYVVAINDFIQKKIHICFYLTSLLAILGAAIIVWQNISSDNFLFGFLLMQISNIAFAFGQIYYKKFMSQLPNKKDTTVFALLYFGGFLTALIFSLFTTDFRTISLTNNEIMTILYLGIIASGVGFFLWNYGARKTNAGSLAIFNNLKIPIGIFVSILFFKESVDLLNLLFGGLIVTIALGINEYWIYKNKHKLN
jgi:drug/metabolite transporter (DMT)-like permease